MIRKSFNRRLWLSVTLASGLATMVVGHRAIADDTVVDFDNEIIPVLTKSGCNAGACHGAAIGRGGFKLSLLGSNPAADYESIVRSVQGRRVNLVHPEKSLLLRKPSEQTGHEGGLVLDQDSAGFSRVQQWVREGAQRSDKKQLTQLIVDPKDAYLTGRDPSAAIRVTAKFSDGATHNVTQWTVLKPDDPEAVSVQPIGDGSEARMTVGRPGVHVVVARFLSAVVPIRLTVPITDQWNRVSNLDADNVIDEFINLQLAKVGLKPGGPTDDWAFARRVWIDLTGRLPSSDELRKFVQDPTPNKRDTLVDRLLQSDAFADLWAFRWAEALAIDSKTLGPAGAQAYHRWLTDQFARDAPISQTAAAMLTSTGDGHVTGPVNFIRSGSNPGELAELASSVLMGARLDCANCHDHPLDHWTQDDYHGLAAVFASFDRGRVVMRRQRGEVTHPLTGEPAQPKIPGEAFLEDGVDGPTAFADWLTSPQNDYFARAMVNRVWSHLMGRGLVDPVNDMRVTNPATHPKLLQSLADDFIEHDFRIKPLVAAICQTQAYQRDSRPPEGQDLDTTFYSHALTKSMSAEVIADAIADVTGVPIRLEDGTSVRTLSLTDNLAAVDALEVLGRCDRSVGCLTSDPPTVSLARSLHLISGELVNSRVSDSSGDLRRLLSEIPDDDELLQELLIRTIARPDLASTQPWTSRLERIEQSDTKARREFFEDVFWGLITSEAFSQNR